MAYVCLLAHRLQRNRVVSQIGPVDWYSICTVTMTQPLTKNQGSNCSSETSFFTNKLCNLYSTPLGLRPDSDAPFCISVILLQHCHLHSKNTQGILKCFLCLWCYSVETLLVHLIRIQTHIRCHGFIVIFSESVIQQNSFLYLYSQWEALHIFFP